MSRACGSVCVFIRQPRALCWWRLGDVCNRACERDARSHHRLTGRKHFWKIGSFAFSERYIRRWRVQPHRPTPTIRSAECAIYHADCWRILHRPCLFVLDECYLFDCPKCLPFHALTAAGIFINYHRAERVCTIREWRGGWTSQARTRCDIDLSAVVLLCAPPQTCLSKLLAINIHSFSLKAPCASSRIIFVKYRSLPTRTGVSLFAIY